MSGLESPSSVLPSSNKQRMLLSNSLYTTINNIHRKHKLAHIYYNYCFLLKDSSNFATIANSIKASVCWIKLQILYSMTEMLRKVCDTIRRTFCQLKKKLYTFIWRKIKSSKHPNNQKQDKIVGEIVSGIFCLEVAVTPRND